MTRKQLDLSLARITPEQRCLMLALVQQDRTIRRHRALRAFVAFCALLLAAIAVGALR